ncbi:Probable protein phosphatase 2C 26 [Linum perenne]
MAIPVFRASIPHSNPQFHFLLPNPWMRFGFGNSSPRKNLMFHHLPLASSSSDLNSPRSEVLFCVGTHLIPHPSKVDTLLNLNLLDVVSFVADMIFSQVEKGGEDAFFISSYNGGVCAIADGVSGWAKKNVDPSLFSRELMANASCLVQDEEVALAAELIVILEFSLEKHMLLPHQSAQLPCKVFCYIVAMLERNGTLKVANVGDCGLKLIRGGQIIFSTSPQEHYFDCPYQLSSETIGQTYLDAMISNVEVMEGDTIVMGSDGLFDNVFDHEIVSTIAQHKNVNDTAKVLANLAKVHSLDSSYESPYALEARSKV